MRALLLGGTGTISTKVTQRLLQLGWDVWLVNRGSHPAPAGARQLVADVTNESDLSGKLAGKTFDAVVNFIAYTPGDILRDHRIFSGKTGQYVFVSSASAYQKPCTPLPITEDTPLHNPYWQYSRDKIACEETLMQLWRQESFPATIVRPSHTYAESKVPVGLYGTTSWQVIRRMTAGKPVLVHGDGTSLWTFTHSRDFAQGFCGLLGNQGALGQAVHITSDEAITWTAAYETIAGVLGVPFTPLYVASGLLAQAGRPFGYDFEGSLLGDKANCAVFDNTKIKTLVPAFRADTSFEKGVRETIENILATPTLQKQDDAFDFFSDRMAQELSETLRRLSP